MEYTEVIYLIKREKSQDEIGNIIYIDTKRKTYAKKKKVSIKEFYNAVGVGLSIDAELQIKVSNYKGEELVEYNGQVLNIIRTIPVDRLDVILVLGLKEANA